MKYMADAKKMILHANNAKKLLRNCGKNFHKIISKPPF